VITECPFAIQYPDPTPNLYAGENGVKGVILHSAEGYKGGLWAGIENEGVSWHFSILYDGSIWQHHPLTARCWHAGSTFGNFNLIGIEHEGIAGEPLTPLQRAASVRLTRWIAEQGGWRMERAAGPSRTLWEHREQNNTTCPNGRIPWDAYTPAPVVSEEIDVRTLPLDFNETAALFRGIAANVVEIIMDKDATAELVVSGYTAHPERDTYVIQIPRGTGRQ